MFEDVKICPECGAEYFAHVEECKECGVRLLHPEEKAELDKKASEPVREVGVGGAGSDVCIEQGPHSRIRELADALDEKGIGYEIVKAEDAPGGRGGACSTRHVFSLIVPEDLSEQASEAIEEYFHRLHPEVKEAKEMLDKGLCPCCGYNVEGMSVCGECGLALEGPSPAPSPASSDDE